MLEGAQRMIADLKMDPSRSKRTGADAARSYEVIILKEPCGFMYKLNVCAD